MSAITRGGKGCCRSGKWIKDVSAGLKNGHKVLHKPDRLARHMELVGWVYALAVYAGRITNIIDAELVDSLPSTVSDPLVVSTSMIAQANELHYEISSLESVIASAGMRSVFATLRLGHILCQLKEETAHGEFALLFSDAQRRLKGDAPNATHVSHLSFSSRHAQRYISTYRKARAEFIAQVGTDDTLLNCVS